MKKQILLFFLSFFVMDSFSQTTPWISSGATWYYQWDGGWVIGNNKIEYTHDTILYGKICEILKTTNYSQLASPPHSIVSTSIGYEYTYSNGDTVFYLVDTTFEVLYNFGASTGNTWDLGVDTNYAYCSNSIVSVDSTSSITIGSNSHRILYTTDSSNSSIGISGTIIEHIGSMTYLFPIERVCDTTGVVEYVSISFSCFSDSLVSYSVVPASECANPYHVGIKDLETIENEVTIFPNPAKDQIILEWSNSTYISLSICNTMGQFVTQKNITSINSEIINISNFNPGIYIIYLETKDGIRKTKRFVKE